MVKKYNLDDHYRSYKNEFLRITIFVYLEIIFGSIWIFPFDNGIMRENIKNLMM